MLEGIVRESTGKQATKTLRRDGYLIANIYGKDVENINAAFKANDYIRTVKKKDSIAFDVNVGGKELKVVAQDYQSHPITGDLLHVDLMVAQTGVESKYMIPVNPMGSPVGLKNKGLLHVSKKRLAVKAKPEDLPASIDIDVAPLDLGDSILIRDLEAPANTRFVDADRVSVLSIIKAK